MSASRSWTIGADPSCDLVISQEFVSGRHCRLTETPAGYVLEDLGSTNGTFVNGARLTGSRPVARSDRITLGATTPMPWPAAPPSPPPPAPPSPSTGRAISVGRGPENDVVLDYPTVSTRHARIVVDGGTITIEDLGSTNGTFLGSLDRRVTRSPLSPGDTVYFGTQPIPASRLLGGAVPNGGPAGTLVVDARSVVPPTAPRPGGLADRLMATAPATSPGGPPPTLGVGRSVPPAVLGGAIAAAVVLVGAIGLWMARGDSSGDPDDGNGENGAQVEPGGQNGGENGGQGGVPGASGVGSLKAGDPQRAIFAVLIDSRGDDQRRVLGNIGSAAAIADRRLITSAGVATEVRRALAESWDVSVFHPVLKRELRVVAATAHPEYTAAQDEFQTAEGEHTSLREQLETLQKAAKEGKGDAPGQPKGDKPPAVDGNKLVENLMAAEDRMLKAKEREIHFDVGALEVEGTLPDRIAVAPGDAAIKPRAKLRLMGVPGDPKDPEVTRSELKSPLEAAGRFGTRPPMIEAKGVGKQSMFTRNADDPSASRNWAGGAVLDDDGKLVAVFSRPTPPLKPNEPPSNLSGEIVPTVRWSSLLR